MHPAAAITPGPDCPSGPGKEDPRTYSAGEGAARVRLPAYSECPRTRAPHPAGGRPCKEAGSNSSKSNSRWACPPEEGEPAHTAHTEAAVPACPALGHSTRGPARECQA